MPITLTRRRTAKNGIVSYKATTKRTSGTCYLDKKMFLGEAPETIILEGENLVDSRETAVSEQPQPEPQPA